MHLEPAGNARATRQRAGDLDVLAELEANVSIMISYHMICQL